MEGPGGVPVTEPLLLERLGMDDGAFLAFITQVLGGVPTRRFTPEVLATALGYPWERPARSYVLDGTRVEPVDDLAPARRAQLLAAPATGFDGEGRHPLLAIGSNGAPATLARKLAHLAPVERRVLVLAGELHGFDVGAAAHPTAYGAMPATLFERRGTAMRAAVLWVTAAQLTQLSWTEITYRLERLEPIVFAPDDEVEEVTSVWAYVSRWGTFCPDGEPLALAAIPARARTVEACSQEALLDRAAQLAFGAQATAATLVRAVFEDLAGLAAGGSLPIRATGRPLTTPAWRPWPAAGP